MVANINIAFALIYRWLCLLIWDWVIKW